MKEKEFDLSEKIMQHIEQDNNTIFVDDVKEAVKILKEKAFETLNETGKNVVWVGDIDKIFGEKLI